MLRLNITHNEIPLFKMFILGIIRSTELPKFNYENIKSVLFVLVLMERLEIYWSNETQSEYRQY